MADKVEKKLMDTLISLSEAKPLKKISLIDLLESASVSRTAFNNRFRDMNDLICQIWLRRTVECSWNDLHESYENYYLSALISFKRHMNYLTFFSQAFAMEDQNCLRDFAIAYALQFDAAQFAHYVEEKKITPDQAQFASSYHAYGITNLVANWMIHGGKETPEQMAKLTTDMRYGLLKACIDSNSSKKI